MNLEAAGVALERLGKKVVVVEAERDGKARFYGWRGRETVFSS